ncbi:MAG: WG repeat-containing protein [Microcoleus sp.]
MQKKAIFFGICLICFLLLIAQPTMSTTYSQNTESKTVYKYGFINKKGQYVVPPQFDTFYGFSEGLAVVEREGKQGYVDTTGKIVIPFKFEGVTHNFSEGLATATLKRDDKIGYIDKTGNYVISPQFDEARDFVEGLAVVKIKDKYGYDKYGYIDKKGKYAVQPQFDYATRFYQGLALVEIRNDKTSINKYGLIDKTGKYRLKPSFDYIQDPDSQGISALVAEFKEGLMRVGVVDESCPKKNDTSDYVKKKFGFIDRTGKIVIPLKFESVGDFYNGRAVALFRTGTTAKTCDAKGGKYGYIDRTGEVVIPPQFDEASDFSEGLAAVTIGKKSGYIDVSGKFVINEPKFSEGLAIVRSRDNGLYGYINKTGKFVIPPRFSFTLGFNNGWAIVEINGKRGMIDKTGKYIIEPKFDSVTTFSEGLAIVGVHENGEQKYGYVDQTGKIVIEPQFDEAGFFEQGLAVVRVKIEVKIQKDCENAECNNQSQPSGSSPHLSCKLRSAIKALFTDTKK